MRTRALVAVSLTALTLLTGCSPKEEPQKPGAAPSESASSEPTADADRFQTTYQDVADLFKKIEAQPDVDPRNAKQANEAAGLDESTNLIFDSFNIPKKGVDDADVGFCLEADNATYASFFSNKGGIGVALGDGVCADAPEGAEVVGDFMTEKWTTGGDLMGDLTVTSIYAN